jgi:hypothetical protein
MAGETMDYTLDTTWHVTNARVAFGHTVRFHQSGSAVIMEIDGLCLVGDAALLFGQSKIVFPRQLALCPTLDDAKRAVELAYQQHQERLPERDEESEEPR